MTPAFPQAPSCMRLLSHLQKSAVGEKRCPARGTLNYLQRTEQPRCRNLRTRRNMRWVERYVRFVLYIDEAAANIK
jgi:hypothetical protein